MIIYTSDEHDLAIHAIIGSRGRDLLARLGFKSDHERAILAKKTAEAARLQALRVATEDKKRAEQTALEVEALL